jgi:predicted ester cyclase
MTGTSRTTRAILKTDGRNQSYGSGSDLVDFILGITFEIWEQRQVEKILDYYAEDVQVYSLEGMTTGAEAMVSGTHATLVSFPDRLLLADDVIACGTAKKGFSSHRITSPMTHLGDHPFGKASGKQLRITNIADCEINDGVITREWLIRDNLALARQIGLDPLDCAGVIARKFDDHQTAWLAKEFSRASNQDSPLPVNGSGQKQLSAFVETALTACWLSGDDKVLETIYAPYCVMHRSPVQCHSGRERILQHYAHWRNAFPGASLCIDHVCSSPFDLDNQRIAVRWSVAGLHQGEFAGAPASGKPVYILGVTHWKLVDGKIAVEWTVFDELAMLAQTLV